MFEAWLQQCVPAWQPTRSTWENSGGDLLVQHCSSCCLLSRAAFRQPAACCCWVAELLGASFFQGCVKAAGQAAGRPLHCPVVNAYSSRSSNSDNLVTCHVERHLKVTVLLLRFGSAAAPQQAPEQAEPSSMMAGSATAMSYVDYVAYFLQWAVECWPVPLALNERRVQSLQTRRPAGRRERRPTRGCCGCVGSRIFCTIRLHQPVSSSWLGGVHGWAMP
ncbi:hypothetical protein COO60DRAFT_748604 [Scenedesmus sp. NREL 46B-D3]|nr:hypothetical protein COO60DRAFT_748604 [Scenedesmus sp. NREL 46B-D3]